MLFFDIRCVTVLMLLLSFLMGCSTSSWMDKGPATSAATYDGFVANVSGKIDDAEGWRSSLTDALIVATQASPTPKLVCLSVQICSQSALVFDLEGGGDQLTLTLVDGLSHKAIQKIDVAANLDDDARHLVLIESVSEMLNLNSPTKKGHVSAYRAKRLTIQEQFERIILSD